MRVHSGGGLTAIATETSLRVASPDRLRPDSVSLPASEDGSQYQSFKPPFAPLRSHAPTPEKQRQAQGSSLPLHRPQQASPTSFTMASSKSPNGADRLPVYGTKEDAKDETAVLDFDRPRQARVETPESDEQQNGGLTPNTPGLLAPFDWEDFEARYEKALVEADEHEREILKEAESLAKYFQVWSSAASAYDDERAVKRLQTRQRFVNIAEERMAQRQQHHEEVVRAFESALALLRST